MTIRERIRALGSILAIVLCLPAALIYDYLRRVAARRNRRAAPAAAIADAAKQVEV